MLAGAVEQAVSNKGALRNALRIDGLLLPHPTHLELSVLDSEGESPLDQVERVFSELLVAPAAEDIEVLADSRGERFEIVGSCDEPCGDARFLSSNLEQQLQEIADQSRVLRQAGTAGFTVRHFIGAQRLGGLNCAHQPASDIVGPPPGGQAANPPEVVLRLRRMKDDFIQRVVLDDPAAREVLRPRLGLAPRRERLQSAEDCGIPTW